MAGKYRYTVALPRGSGRVFLAWRLLADDAPGAPFHVERLGPGGAWQRLTEDPVIDSTTFVDTTPVPGEHQYRIVDAGGAASEAVRVDSSAPSTLVALDVPLDPDHRHTGLILGDLENNARMGFVLRSLRGHTLWLSAYSHEGALLWERDTCLPVGAWQAHVVPFLCWDINCDGRSEVVFRRDKEWSGVERHEATGPDETIVAVDGQTGQVVWERPWPGTRERVMMTVGHLRGQDEPACVVVQDETYRDSTLTALDGVDGRVFWRLAQPRPAGHNLDIADIDADGVQEVICGGACYNGDGSLRWEAEAFGHTDISKPARIDPGRDGLQIWFAVESDNPGVYLVDNRGRTIFKEPFRHAHYGWVARHTSDVPGLQPHTAEDARHEWGAAERGAREEQHNPIFLPDGSHWLNLSEWQRKNFVPVHWDDGPEVTFVIRKENKRVVRLLATGEIEDLPDGRLPEGGRYGRNLACADVVGDFRENIVTVDEERHRLMVLCNPNPATRRGRSPFEHFEYRHDRSQHGSGYYIYLSPPVTVVSP